MSPDKYPNSFLRGIRTGSGVEIVSRYDHVDEYKLMNAAIGSLPDNLTAGIVNIFCDSKASRVYAVDLKRPDERLARSIAEALAAWFLANAGGHNGVYVKHDRHFLASCDPDWGD